jgi:hypothetical protein
MGIAAFGPGQLCTFRSLAELCAELIAPEYQGSLTPTVHLMHLPAAVRERRFLACEAPSPSPCAHSRRSRRDDRHGQILALACAEISGFGLGTDLAPANARLSQAKLILIKVPIDAL